MRPPPEDKADRMKVDPETVDKLQQPAAQRGEDEFGIGARFDRYGRLDSEARLDEDGIGHRDVDIAQVPDDGDAAGVASF